jgi:aminodeoxyfutalosine deaminase
LQLETRISKLPLAELHLHLEGTVTPATLNQLRRLHGETPFTEEEFAALYSYSDFRGFLQAFKTITDHLRTPADYELAAYEMMRALAAQGVVHAEVYFSAGIVFWRGYELEPIFEALERGRQRGARDFGISLLWLFDAVRQFGPEAAQRVAEAAVRFRDCNVAGFGIGGDERRASPELFRDVYAWARDHGLRLTVHAGESAGPQSIWGALNLGAERLGHALTAWQDPALLDTLVERQVPLEISVTSNLRTKCCASLESHPLGLYFERGALVTLNTDDPALFGNTLTGEYELARSAFGLSGDHLRELARNSFEASFLPPEEKLRFLDLLDSHS